MNLWSVRAATKTSINWGKWEKGKMSKSTFPLSKARTKFYRLGNAFTWRKITFCAKGYQYRLLVAYRTDKEQFSAMLGMDDAGDTKVVARLEFHGTHGGWHMHYATGSIGAVPAGIRVGPWTKRRDCNSHPNFGLGNTSELAEQARVMTIISEVFGLQATGGML